MSDRIKKGDESANRLMDEIEALFDMTIEQRDSVVGAVNVLTDPSEPAGTYEDLYEMGGLSDCKISGQPLHAEDVSDGDGSPDGGFVESTGLQVRWQRGPIDKESSPPWNGSFPVTVLEAVLHRLLYYQNGKFACQDNEVAIEHIEAAIETLNERQVERFCRGVQGGHKK